MKVLTKNIYDYKNVVSYGNMFLLGNGHIGYRGTLEEFSKDELVALTLNGFFDRYKKKWRENVNLPNPFYIKTKTNYEDCNVLVNAPVKHSRHLDITKAIFCRNTEFESLIISSERFVSNAVENTLEMKYVIIAKKDVDVEINIGMDPSLWEINGPHYKRSKYFVKSHNIIFHGTTNERKNITEIASYNFKGFIKEKVSYGYIIKTHLVEGEKREIYCKSHIFENALVKNSEKINRKIYLEDKKNHSSIFANKFDNARVKIIGDNEAQDELDYSVYQLSILSNPNYKLSIPARGVSGQTYKGAIFWDTEIFLIPYFIYTDPIIARNCLMYRINTLTQAKENAKKYGYDGAFYPWESQEGKEMCSTHNVTDIFTGKPIRTYFNEKQIHSSSDVALSIYKYVSMTGDRAILDEGGLEVIKECVKFYQSYAVLKDGVYHIYDVIGPDEYHERVNDNAFTNYSIKKTVQALIKLLPTIENRSELEHFEKNLFFPKLNADGVYEQFTGYFKLEDVKVDEVCSRIRDPREYWGGKLGVATKTKVIKQADVVAMLCFFKKDFDKEIVRANYNYYLPYTEHGSSLSCSMYGLAALEVGDYLNAYEMFRKSASIDLGTNQKTYAGGIYIGGTHPASNAGAYLDVIDGFCGLTIKNNSISFEPHLPEGWKRVEFKFNYLNKKYFAKVSKKGSKLEEIL